MSHYNSLAKKKEKIYKSNKRKSLSEIAAIIGRSIETVSRELKREIPAIRGTGQGIKAPEKCCRPLLMAKGQLRKVVSRLLVEEQWSSEQISNRLAKE